MTLRVYFSNEQNKFSADEMLERLVHRAVRGVLENEGIEYDCSVSVTFVDNEGIKELNRDYRDKDVETDVLSFPMYAFTEDDMPMTDHAVELGDIVLSLEKASSQAEEFGHSYNREVAFLTVHSVLHLLGYDHVTSEEDEAEMRRKQREVMEKLDILR
ncbi:MAG: rRNA maturation RNase YbeY [Clostridia bacterium]|nr:rRNA maturation RNase YbeY [Clostridia bacterium]